MAALTKALSPVTTLSPPLRREAPRSVRSHAAAPGRPRWPPRTAWRVDTALHWGARAPSDVPHGNGSSQTESRAAAIAVRLDFRPLYWGARVSSPRQNGTEEFRVALGFTYFHICAHTHISHAKTSIHIDAQTYIFFALFFVTVISALVFPGRETGSQDSISSIFECVPRALEEN